MKRKYIYIIFIAIFMLLLSINNNTYAADLDRILNYEVTVDPRMNDGTLDIIYEITWKVLDSTTEGPLEWVQIGTANSNFDNPTALSKNIRSITNYNGSYVKIVFKDKYYAGEQVTFKYKIHQSSMHKVSWGKCKYSFTPAWFTNAKIDKMTVRWNMDSIKSSNAKYKQDNYLVWTKTNMSKGEKLTVNIKYDKNEFSSLSSYSKTNNYSNSDSYNFTVMFVILFIIVYCMLIINGGGGYYRHRGFYGGYGYRHYGRSCVRSSCACARSSCASSCACACAGSGRAGCSRKDFYGTKINKSKLKNVMD